MAEAARPLPADEPHNETEPIPTGGRSLKQAVVTALILVGLIGTAYVVGTAAFFVLAFTVVMLALFEFLDGLRHANHAPNTIFILLCGATMLIVAYLERPAYYSIVLAVATFGGFALALLPGPARAAGSDVAWGVLGLAWIAGGGAAAVSILMLEPGGMALLIATVLTVAGDDVAAYFVGTRFGRHKMAPSISPAKSWEGFAGGVVGALLAGALFGWLLNELNVVEGVALGAIASITVPVGDLVESRFKREIGIKDSGRLLPGHGGFLDRLDAILFTAPAAFIFLRFVVF
ncbi:MAG: phosphatidate cytidylyltransferase [Actinomycetota bacterium]|nr:phosphatidate cytidylyltransferase [Actinomycetota bacterium]